MTEAHPLVVVIVRYLAFLFALTVHECAHAWVAWRCGDSTARLQGRMTLNPLPHIDPLGTVLIPLLPSLLVAFGGGGGMPFALIGWGKPVPVNPALFRNGSRDDVLVSVAGPLSNLVLTIAALALLKALTIVALPAVQEAAELFLGSLAGISFFLAFFNMLPLPPLDGSHLLRYFLSFNGRQMFDKISRHGFLILIVMVNTPVWDIIAGGISVMFTLLCALYGL